MHRLLFLLLIGTWVACAGCERRRVEHAKLDLRKKPEMLAVLRHVPETRIVDLPLPRADTAVGDLALGDVVVRLPAWRTVERRHDDQAVLHYDDFLVILTLFRRGEYQVDSRFGPTPFEQVRTMYRIGEAELNAAQTSAETALVLSAVAHKSVAIPLLAGNAQLADQRFVEFRSPRWRGFIHGSTKKGATGVDVTCFAVDDPQRVVTLCFGITKPGVTDAELERYIAAVAWLPAAAGTPRNE